MTVRDETVYLRKLFNADRLNLSQVAFCLGVDRKTAAKKIGHLPVLNMDGTRRWRVKDIAEFIYLNEERTRQ